MITPINAFDVLVTKKLVSLTTRSDQSTGGIIRSFSPSNHSRGLTMSHSKLVNRVAVILFIATTMLIGGRVAFAQFIWIQIDCMHPEVTDDPGSDDTIKVELMLPNNITRTSQLSDASRCAFPYDQWSPSKSFDESGYNESDISFRLSTTGQDAFFMDRVRVRNGEDIYEWGRQGGLGWCLSADPGDYDDWSSQTSGCYSCLEFNADGNAYVCKLPLDFSLVQKFTGDWNNDNKDTIAVRIGNLIKMDTNGDGVFDKEQRFGNGDSEDQYLVGDWDGDGTDNIAIRRGNHILFETTGDTQHDSEQRFGNGNEEYLVGNWDGSPTNLTDNIAIRRGNEILMDTNGDTTHDLPPLVLSGDL